MRKFGKFVLAVSSLFLTSSAFALSPECTQLALSVTAQPGVGGTSDNTYIRWFKFPHTAGAPHFESGAFVKNVTNPMSGFHDSSPEHQLRALNALYPGKEYTSCTISRDTSGRLKSISLVFDGAYRYKSGAQETATVTMTASKFSRAVYGLPPGADAWYFELLDYNVKIASSGSTPIAGKLKVNRASTGGTDQGTGFVWLNSPLNWSEPWKSK